MDFLKAQLARLQAQYASLNKSQKMLAVSLVAIMLMTALFWGRYAGQPEMEAVLDQDLSPDDVTRITTELTARGIAYRMNGSRVMVPADQKLVAIADITFNQLLPHDTVNAFDEIVGKMSSPWDGPEKTGAIYNRTKEVMLAQVMRNFPGVRNAAVMIDPTVKRNFGNAGILPSASVSINLKPGSKFDKRLVESAASLVAGAVAAMPKSRVKVVIDGATHTVADDAEDGGAVSSAMDLVRDWERHYAGKISEQLAYIDGTFVHVTVKVDTDRTQKQTLKFDPKGVVQKESSVKSETEENQNASRGGGGDPGVTANTGLTIPGSSGGGAGGDSQTQNREKTDTAFDNRFSQEHITTSSGPGNATVLAASVSLPRSYFSKGYKSRMRTDKEPDDKVLDTYISAQLAEIRSTVKACVGLSEDLPVVVNTYIDLMPEAADAAPAQSAVSSLIGGHVKEIALGALALLSLFMASMMMRKGGSAALATAGAGAEGADGGDAAGGPGGAGKAARRAAGIDEATEVGEGAGALDGVELDDEAVRAQQVVEQVSTMVKENPEAAANLVKRWLSHV